MREAKSIGAALTGVAALLNGGAVMVASSVLQAPRNIILCLVFGLIFAVVFNGAVTLFLRANKWTRVIAAAGMPLLMWRLGMFAFLGEIAERYIVWVSGYDLADAEPPAFAVMITMLLAGTVSALYTTPFVIRRPSVLVILPIFMAIIFLPYHYYDPVQMRIAVTAIIFALLYLAVLSGYFRVKRRYNGKLGFRPYRTVGLALCAVITLAAAFIPADDEWKPITLGRLRAANNPFFNIFVPASLRVVRLNDTGEVKLGGGNTAGGAHLFDVRSYDLLYLYANTYDRYTGASWESTDGGKMRYSRQRYADIWSGWEYGANPNLTSGAPISVLYHNISTGSLLLPRRLTAVRVTSGGSTVYMKEDLTLSVEPDAGEGFSYEAWAVRRTLYDVLNRAADLFGAFEEGSLYLAPYQGTHGLRDERYLELPASVTERTRALASEITAGETSDLLKALAIQDYLSAAYPYTRDAPEIPEGADFVDYFLFEAKTGYCTSYASAMVVMLRALGIQARYSEGFALDREYYEDGVFRVFEGNAHAWVEMYTPYGGWVEFDPTGSDSAAAYRRNQLRQRSEGTSEYYSQEAAMAYAEEQARLAMEQYARDMDRGASGLSEQQDEAESITTAERGFLQTLAVILITPLIPALWIFGGRLYVRMKLKRVRRRPPTEQARFWYGRMLGLLKGEGFTAQRYESMRVFAARVRESMPSGVTRLMPAVALMERVIYNDGEVSVKELPAFTAAHDQLFLSLHAGWGRLRQLWEKHVTLRSLWTAVYNK